MTRAVLTRAFFAGAILVTLQAASHAANLVAHRAFYTLEAARLDDGSGISQISGKLAYEITGSACEGYSVSYRIANRYVQSEGSAQVSDLQLTSYESADALELDLRQKQFTNSKLEQESRIKVKRPSVGAAGEGEITAAENKTFALDPAALFPTEFQKKLVDAASRGETRHSAIVYEGSEGEKPLRAISFIGGKRQVSEIRDDTPDKSLRGMSSETYWPVTISYYDTAAKGDDPPVYQATFNMLANGISTDLLMDYGGYALRGRLDKLELLKQDACN
jgi:hypothetical protein